MLQSAFVPGRVNSTGTRPRVLLSSSLSNTACPWKLVGITVTTQLPAHRHGSLHLLLLKDAVAFYSNELVDDCC